MCAACASGPKDVDIQSTSSEGSALAVAGDDLSQLLYQRLVVAQPITADAKVPSMKDTRAMLADLANIAGMEQKWKDTAPKTLYLGYIFNNNIIPTKQYSI